MEKEQRNLPYLCRIQSPFAIGPPLSWVYVVMTYRNPAMTYINIFGMANQWVDMHLNRAARFFGPNNQGHDSYFSLQNLALCD